MWATILWNYELPLIQWGIVIGASLVAALIDIRSGRIPNLLTGPLLVAGFLWAGFAGGLGGVADAALACFLLSLPFVLLFLFGGGGAGDAKLMGALGAWLGIVNGTVALLSVSVAGIFLAVGFALAKKNLVTSFANVSRITQSALMVVLTRGSYSGIGFTVPKTKDMQTIPYGVAIFMGMILAAAGVYIWRA